MADRYLFRLIGLDEQFGSVVDKKNASRQIGRPVLGTLMKTLVLSDEKIRRPFFKVEALRLQHRWPF